MISGTFQIIRPMSESCFTAPPTVSRMAPDAMWPVVAAGWIGLHGQEWSKLLPISQGSPLLPMSRWRSRRVMSMPMP